MRGSVDRDLDRLVADIRGVESPAALRGIPSGSASIPSITGWRDCVEVLRDGTRFSSSIVSADVAYSIGHSMLDADGDEHRRLREPFRWWFSRPQSEARIGQVATRVLRSLLATLPSRTTIDLVEAYLQPFPVLVIGEILGIGADDLVNVTQFHGEVAGAVPERQIARRAHAELTAFYADSLKGRVRHPKDDLLTVIAKCFDVGTAAGLAYGVAHARLFFDAGTNTTYRGTTSLVADLLRAPRMSVERGSMNVESRALATLRVDPPVRQVHRLCTQETMVGQRLLHKGQVIAPLISSANRDAARPVGRHLSFGWGPHACLGMHLGLAEMTIAVRELFKAYPRITAEKLPSDGTTDALFRLTPELLVRLDR